MIPIKKLKAKIIKEFERRSDAFNDAIEKIQYEAKIHYINIPWGLEGGGIIVVRYDTRKLKFDRIKFNAFGKEHTIKL